ncbi:MAG: hypothetical protein WD771_01040 [Gemmatimonadaceae bacterium]
MTRRDTPKPVKATGARDAHGRILDAEGGSLYVHLHRENGLAHRHYVLQPWKVRFLAFASSRAMILLYVVGILTWGWMASQAARVPLLRQEVGRLTRDANRLDTLSATLAELQMRYDQVQRMLGAATARQAAEARDTSRTPRDPTNMPPGVGGR